MPGAEAARAAALVVERLRAGWGETMVLEDVSFTLPQRGALAVLGRNGVGKSTLLATVMGHTKLHSGTIKLKGQEIEASPVHARALAGIGYVPQEREIFPSLTVEENLTVAARPGPSGERRWTLEGIYELFPRLTDRRSHLGNQISGGEQQMLAIGRALMGNPELLLLDEPLEGLAPIIVEGLLLALRKLITQDALAVVLVEQSARLALEVTQDAIVLDRGRLTYSGASQPLLDDPQRLAALFVAQ
jgi:branched-chain amino acid transport system ATP-binding protein